MHPLLQTLLGKRGIETVNELDMDEKAQYDQWEKILSKEELTIEDVKQFCKSQVEVIEGKWKDLNVENTKKAELIPYHTVYKTLLSAIDSPRSARESLEQQLINLTKQ